MIAYLKSIACTYRHPAEIMSDSGFCKTEDTAAELYANRRELECHYS